MIDVASGPLIEQAKGGDEVAFQRLLAEVTRDGFRLAVAMLHDPVEAEDVLQEAAWRAWSRIDQHRAGTTFRPWFLGIVANQCRMVRRARWFSVIRQDAPSPARRPDPPGLVRDLDLERALRMLPARDRAAVTLYFYLDLPLVEVGQALGLSATAAKSRIQRALKRMRPLLDFPEVTI